MAKFVDYSVSPEIKDIMENIIQRFPDVFPGFDPDKIGCVHAHDKEAKKPIQLISVRYPYDVWIDKVYICSVRDATWKNMNQKQKNLAVFHIMCAIPEGGFDTESNKYSRIRRPDIQMYMEEFAACGGVPNWMENPDASDPMTINQDIIRNPVTIEAVSEV